VEEREIAETSKNWDATALRNRVQSSIARILAFLAFFNFFLYLVDRQAAPLGVLRCFRWNSK
jgi:hypothetical protein